MQTQDHLVRTVAGHPVPAPGVWRFDQGHAYVGFEGRHLMISRIRGHFSRFEGRLTVAEVPEESTVELVIDASSLESGFADRDLHLRGAEHFDVERFPTIAFRSTGLRYSGGSVWLATGELEVHGITRPVNLEVDFEGVSIDPWGSQKLGFSATTRVNREDYGMTWNLPLDGGGLVVSREVRLDIFVEAVLMS